MRPGSTLYEERAPLSCDGIMSNNNELHITKVSACRTRVDDGRISGSESSYLVDPASSHMLVSKIKPCMSKYKQVCTVKLRMAH